jgi:antitoxin (DNA-binding transcriptional repressor) of toxin-antitoxin stability system
MAIRSEDIIPINQVRSRFTRLAEAVRSGEEKIITRNGESYVALVDARRLDHYHRIEREHIHIQLLDDAAAGLEDVNAGRTLTPREVEAKYRKRSRSSPRKSRSSGSR